MRRLRLLKLFRKGKLVSAYIDVGQAELLSLLLVPDWDLAYPSWMMECYLTVGMIIMELNSASGMEGNNEIVYRS
ncbi:MAG: hypothetical protein IPH88_18435 [Bacteroidales bacterium]|nr:hypothetical protein [Bacteroidales bacterium]